MKHFLFICIFLGTLSVVFAKEADWQHEVGLSFGNQVPVALHLGTGYKNIYGNIEGLGSAKNRDDFWLGVRGGLGVRIFRSSPFHLNLGISSGYAFAQAPNYLHQAFNEANGGKYLYSCDREETFDLSASVDAHLFGFFSQLNVPVYYFMGNKKPTLLWRIGYLFEF